MKLYYCLVFLLCVNVAVQSVTVSREPRELTTLAPGYVSDLPLYGASKEIVGASLSLPSRNAVNVEVVQSLYSDRSGKFQSVDDE